jgi:hypothetical protein
VINCCGEEDETMVILVLATVLLTMPMSTVQVGVRDTQHFLDQHAAAISELGRLWAAVLIVPHAENACTENACTENACTENACEEGAEGAGAEGAGAEGAGEGHGQGQCTNQSNSKKMKQPTLKDFTVSGLQAPSV